MYKLRPILDKYKTIQNKITIDRIKDNVYVKA
jgi:hypothetical protein